VCDRPRSASDSIGELCIALAHRWEPERLFVIFTAYFDEADTHGPAPTVILAGFLAHAYQWRRFELKLGHLQERYGFKIFHAKDFKAKAGEFRGWSDEKCEHLVSDLTYLVKDNLTEGITIALERDPYLTEYRSPPIPKKMILDSQYGVCFRACLAQIISIVTQRGIRQKLHVVIESGHNNVRDCLRIFNDIKSNLNRRDIDLLGDFTIAKKREKPPLMVSDFLAATYSMMNATGTEHYEDNAPPPPKGEAGLSFLKLNPNSLRRIKEYFEADRQQQIEEWRAKRAARKLSSEASSAGGSQ
jgi:hypothetical protein